MVANTTEMLTNGDAPGMPARPAPMRLEWSALLLFVLGLCSLASPHLMRHAHVHHTSTSTSTFHGGRTSSRSSTRSSRGGTQSELDRDRLHDELSAGKAKSVLPVVSLPASTAVAALPAAVLPRIALARASLPSPANADVPASPSLRSSRGRAPPAA